jgi:hypothetical protein
MDPTRLPKSYGGQVSSGGLAGIPVPDAFSGSESGPAFGGMGTGNRPNSKTN